MPAQIAECASWVVNPDGSVHVTWADGHSNHFLNLEEVQAYILELDQSAVNAEMWLIAWFLARSPNMSNTNLVSGKRLTLDVSAANPIRVQ